MKNSSDRKPMSALKKTALIGGGVLAAGAGGAALALRKKPKLRIGTPLSKSKVVNYNPIKTRQATGRVVDMGARLDAVLRNFQAISTAEEPYNYSPCGPSLDGGRKPNFPSLYLSRSTDKGLMKMQGEGTAVVNYKIRSRSIDENTEDGVPLYGASIEIRSIEPIAGEEQESELSETLYLREFGSMGQQRLKRVEGALMKKLKMTGADTSKFNTTMRPVWKKQDANLEKTLPRAIKRNEGVMPLGPLPARKKIMAKDPAAAERKRAAMFEPKREFAEARDRDGEGRYSAGNVPGADDYAIAGAVAPKKRSVLGAGLVGGAAGGAATYGALKTKTGQKLTERAAKGLLQLKGK